MKILVTGGAGYIGSHTVRKLLSNNHEIVIYDNLVYGHKESIPENVKFIQADLADTEVLDKTFSENNFDAVMHFAAYAYVGESVENPKKYFQNNVINGLNLLNTCIKHNVKKFIFSSSCATYGIPSKLPISESEPQTPTNPYGDTKLFFEKMLKWYSKAYNIKYCCLRYFNAAGAHDSAEIGEHHDPETHLIPLILYAALNKISEIKVFGTDYETPDGTCIRDYIHVNDLADAHILVLENLDKASTSYNLGTGQGNSVKEIITLCKEITGKEIKVVETNRRPGDPPILYANPSKIKEDLDWEAKYDIRKIIETAWKWHSKNPEGFK